jgi:hypothetical protein
VVAKGDDVVFVALDADCEVFEGVEPTPKAEGGGVSKGFVFGLLSNGVAFNLAAEVDGGLPNVTTLGAVVVVVPWRLPMGVAPKGIVCGDGGVVVELTDARVEGPNGVAFDFTAGEADEVMNGFDGSFVGGYEPNGFAVVLNGVVVEANGLVGCLEKV